jgi:hypothetical protein
VLAWLFWHARRPDISEDEYRRRLLHFHDRLQTLAPSGFAGSRTLRYSALAWLPVPTEVYEDWYFVHDSGALDVLDDSVTAPSMVDAHAAVSRSAATAIAGLYRLRAGAPLQRPSHVAWVTKERSEPYEDFIDGLAKRGSVWSRKMVLGQAPEFVVESHDPSASLSPSALLLQPDLIRALP